VFIDIIVFIIIFIILIIIIFIIFIIIFIIITIVFIILNGWPPMLDDMFGGSGVNPESFGSVAGWGLGPDVSMGSGRQIEIAYKLAIADIARLCFCSKDWNIQPFSY
jgi:hypothetical protein